jgi:O-antigen/teichoic acid export membrane protein
MNADLATAAKATGELGLFRRALFIYQKETGQSPAGWVFLALLNFITQIVFRHELAPGEFGTLNTALGVIGLMTVPLLAVNQAFTHYLACDHAAGQSARIDSLRAAVLPVTETFAWIWGAVCFLLVFLLLPLLDLPRFSLQLFTLMNVLIALGGLVSWAVCRGGNQLRLWAWLLAAAALTRVVAGVGLTRLEPWAESGLAAFLLAGFITLTPALRSRETDLVMRWKACRAIWSNLDRDFLLCVGATFSVLLALFLFSSADRIVAQSWFGVATNNNMGLVNWDQFDAYQTAGLLGRALLWGTQPLLWILFAQRFPLTRTTPVSLTFFWIYLGALLLGAILLGCVAQPLSHLFCGPHFQSTASFVPSFAAAMIPLGLLQALGVFSLASRRHHECFVLGGCAVVYTLVLYLVGRQPHLMPAYMFGGGLVSLMVVLFVGIVRWGRKQP